MFVSGIIKLLARLNLYLGILLRRRRPGYRNSKIESILIKRTDRIGDAAVTLPLLLALDKRFKVVVLTSKYNDSFLNKFLSTEIFTDVPTGLFGSLGLMVKGVFLWLGSPRKNPPKYDLFLDLNGLRDLDTFLKVRKDNLCRYYVGFNMGIWNLLLDYALPDYPVLFSQEHILDSCRKLVRDALGCDLDLPDAIDFSDKMTRPADFEMKEEFILVNISGRDQFRGPEPEFYARLIDSLDFSGKIVIMDGLRRVNFPGFKSSVKKDNIVYLERDFSLWELLYIAARSSLYVGADSGISNLLQFSTNAILFFATGIPWVWRPYSKNPYRIEKMDRLIVEQTVNSCGLTKKILYAPVSCRPCFDRGCAKTNCLSSFDYNAVGRVLNDTLTEISNHKSYPLGKRDG